MWLQALSALAAGCKGRDRTCEVRIDESVRRRKYMWEVGVDRDFLVPEPLVTGRFRVRGPRVQAAELKFQVVRGQVGGRASPGHDEAETQPSATSWAARDALDLGLLP